MSALDKKYYHNIDLDSNELKAGRIYNVTTSNRATLKTYFLANTPANFKGYIVYDIDSLSLFTWNGTDWTTAAGGSGTVTSVSAGPGMSFTTITGAGSVSIDTTKVPYLSGGFSTGFLIYNGSSWVFDNSTYLTGITSGQVTTALGYTPVTNARTLTINGTTYDLTADRTWSVGTVTSVGLSMPSAFNVASSPVTGSGTIAITGVGTTDQYVRGDGSLGIFPNQGGGGGGTVYYLNGNVSQGSIGGITMYQLSKAAATGTTANFTKSGTGVIASFITDSSDPNQFLIPSGIWLFQCYLSESGGGSSHAEVSAIVEKWNGTTITQISTGPIEQITNGNTKDLYTFSVTIPTGTTLTLADRIVIQLNISNNASNKTITLYTEDSNVSSVTTTFANGISSLNGLTASAQTFGNDTNVTMVSSGTSLHTLTWAGTLADSRIASATTWNAKESALTFSSPLSRSVNTISHLTTDGNLHVPATSTTNNGKVLTAGATAGSLSWQTPTTGTVTSVTGTAPVVSSGGTTPAISMPAANTSVDGYLTAANWTTFNNKQNALSGTGFVKSTAGSISYDTNIYLTSVTAHNLLSATHGDTLTDTVVRGDIIIGNSTPKWSRLPFPATPTGKILQATPTDVAWSTNPITIGASASVSGSNTGDQTITLSGDVTGSGTGSFGTTIANGAVSLAKMDKIVANSIIGNNTGALATPIALSGTNVTAMLDVFNSTNKGLVPAATLGALPYLFLASDGTWIKIDPSAISPIATDTIVANTTGLSASPTAIAISDLTPKLTTLVGDSGSGGTKGLVPAPVSGDATAGKFLKADGTWAVPAGGGGGGTTTNSLIIKADSGTTEGTDLYTFDGSSAKTINIVAGTNITITKTAGTLTISSTGGSSSAVSSDHPVTLMTAFLNYT